MVDIPIKIVIDNRETRMTREMGSINHKGVELCQTGGPPQEVSISLV